MRSKNDQLQDHPTSSWSAQNTPSGLRPPKDTLDDGGAPCSRDCRLVVLAWLVSDCGLWRLQHQGRCCRGSSLCRRYPRVSIRGGYRRRCLGLVYQLSATRRRQWMGRTVVRSAGSGNLRLLPSFMESIVFFIPFVIIPPLPSLPQFPTTHLAMSLMSLGMI